MNASKKHRPARLPKALTGMEGFDQITRGGLPRGSATLVTGGSGTGKTVFGLQMLANGAHLFDEPGIFVAFEETARQLLANAADFEGPLADLETPKLFFVDAMPAVDTVTVGDFDLSALLAILSAKVQAMKARRIVLDSLDVLLQLLPSLVERRREIHRVQDWLRAHDVTAVITAKLDLSEKALPLEDGVLQYLLFMVGCVVALTHAVENDFSQRRVRIIKYRGSSFSENAKAFVISPRGLEVAAADQPLTTLSVATEKVSTGFVPLDEMLYGGVLRGSTTMITGPPGTAKTTLAGAFAEAAAKRGERTLYVAFDETPEEIVRNLASVNIHLRKHVKNGTLLMHSEYVGAEGAEEHFQRIKGLVLYQRATCLVIDPFTAFSSAGSLASTRAVAARLVRWVKSQGITLLCTSLPRAGESAFSGTILQITTVADTWIYLSFFGDGERNRGLTIIKSRGSNHSNQVREFILASSGLSLAPPYTAQGKVLMGAMRWQKERAEAEAQARLSTEFKDQQAGLDDEIAELDAHVQTFQRTLAAKLEARKAMAGSDQLRQREEGLRHARMVHLRQGGELGSAEATSSAPPKLRRSRKAVMEDAPLADQSRSGPPKGGRSSRKKS
jgi:circadian clock protein KaiC